MITLEAGVLRTEDDMGRDMTNKKCPCGRGRKYPQCCGRWHNGEEPPTPEALMRARYTAFALGRTQFLMATTHPESPHFTADAISWAAELRQFCDEVHFQRLAIVEKTVDGDEGTVHFRARFKRGGKSAVLDENSRFRRLEGRWMYVAEVDPQIP